MISVNGENLVGLGVSNDDRVTAVVADSSGETHLTIQNGSQEADTESVDVPTNWAERDALDRAEGYERLAELERTQNLCDEANPFYFMRTLQWIREERKKINEKIYAPATDYLNCL